MTLEQRQKKCEKFRRKVPTGYFSRISEMACRSEEYERLFQEGDRIVSLDGDMEVSSSGTLDRVNNS